MHIPTETELQQLFDEANLASDFAAEATGTSQERQAELIADEAWEQFNSARSVWEEANPTTTYMFDNGKMNFLPADGPSLDYQ